MSIIINLVFSIVMMIFLPMIAAEKKLQQKAESPKAAKSVKTDLASMTVGVPTELTIQLNGTTQEKYDALSPTTKQTLQSVAAAVIWRHS